MANPQLLDQLLSQWEAAREQGQAPTVAELCRGAPEMLSEVQRCLGALQAVDRALETAPLQSQAASTPTPTCVDGFTILAELGRGGMGVVYKAVQDRLNRVVALKMILAGAHAGPEERARFRTEAEAVARLQHPNIVQIYEVAEHAGQPFLAFEFVDGPSLDKTLAGTPRPSRQAAILVRTLAQAMHYAHQRGIVHRDLKPANILVGDRLPAVGNRPENADGSGPKAESRWPIAVKITDFGLARRIDGPAGPTQTGSILGTPSYMAPEQATGRGPIEPTTDVYALGAILYELLTGRPPFRAATPWDTLNQVIADEPVPPRRLQSKAPRDLEIISLKCLEKDPARRYESALALADDLERFLDEKPIRARPISFTGRALKWARRRPAVAGLLALVLTIGVISFSLVTWKWQQAVASAEGEAKARANAEYARRLAELREEEALEQRKQAEQQRDLSIKVTAACCQLVDLFFTQVSQHRALKNPELEGLRQQLLQIPVFFYKEVSFRYQFQDADFQAHRGKAFLNLAVFHEELGAPQKAIPWYQRAAEVFEQLARSRPDQQAYRRDLDLCRSRLEKRAKQ